MAYKPLQLALLLGQAIALPQPGWEGWVSDQSSATISTTKDPKIAFTKNVSSANSKANYTSSSNSTRGWHKWATSSTTASPKFATTTWAGWNQPSVLVSEGWDNWRPESPNAGSYSPDSIPSSSWSQFSDSGYTASVSSSNTGRPGYGPSGNGQSGYTQSNYGQSESVDSSDGWSPWDSTVNNGWTNEPAEYSIEAPTYNFVPSIHWDHDLSDPKYIKPAGRNSFYLTIGGADSAQAHDMAWLHINFTSQAVALDHSNLFSYTYASSSDSVSVSFKTQQGYNTAQSNWQEGLFVVFYNEACEDGQCWLQVDTITFNDASSSCELSCHSLSMEEACHYYEFEWGQYEPAHGVGNDSGDQGGRPGSGFSTSATLSTSSASKTSTITSISAGTSPTGGVTPGNYAVGKVETPNNCTAPKDIVYGLPTACLGRSFDEYIDDSYGYQSVAKSSFAGFAPDYADYYRDDAGITTDEERAGWGDDDEALAFNTPFQKRIIGKIYRVVVKPVAKLIPISGIGKPLNINLVDKTFDLRAPQQKELTDTKKWDKQALIKEWTKKSTNGNAEGTLKVFCVDCGSKGSANIKGSIGISVAEGIDYLRGEVKADIEVALKLGMEMNLEYSNTYNKNFFQVGIPKLSYEPWLTVGPFIRVGAEVELKASAEGTILVGGIVGIKQASANFDVIGFNGQSSGWRPEFTPVFEAEGQIEASAQFGLPLALAIGISANRGKYSADVALVDKPSIKASAKISGSADLRGGQIGEPGECNGIDTALTFNNELYIQWPNKNKLPLFSIDPMVLAGKCISIPGLTTGQNNPPADDAGTSAADNGSANQDLENNGQTTDPSNGSEGADPFAERRRSLNQPRYRRQSNSTDIQDTTDTALAQAVHDTVGYVNLKHGDQNYTITNGRGWDLSVLTDSEKNYQVLSCVNGNLLVFTRADSRKISDYECDRYWTYDADGVISMDGSGRIITFYPDEMSKTGVSRIRAAHPKEIPIGANELTFWSADTDVAGVTKSIYYPIDPEENTYYPVICHFSDNHFTRMFIVKDVDTGIAMLQSSAVKYSITGGNVDVCYYFPMIRNDGRDDQTNRAGLFDYINGLNSTITKSTSTAPRSTSTVLATITATADSTLDVVATIAVVTTTAAPTTTTAVVVTARRRFVRT